MGVRRFEVEEMDGSWIDQWVVARSSEAGGGVVLLHELIRRQPSMKHDDGMASSWCLANQLGHLSSYPNCITSNVTV